MYYENDFPFGIREVVALSGLHVRHKGAASWDIDCPFCGFKKGKLNVNLKKNTFMCNYCGKHGGMLELYALLHGTDKPSAYREIKTALGKWADGTEHPTRRQECLWVGHTKEPEIASAAVASARQKHAVYTRLLSCLYLTDAHKEKLLARGFTEKQVERNLYRSTPAFGFRKLAENLLGAGYEIEGIPGFYQEQDGAWSIRFDARGTGILIPVRNIDGDIEGIQIRMDKVHDGRKYIWLSSAGRPMGASSGSPVHFVGDSRTETVFVTEGPLKGDLSHALSGKAFVCVPGVNQYAGLLPVLERLKQNGTKLVYEAYDMDKFFNCACRHDCYDKCSACEQDRDEVIRESAGGGEDVVCAKKRVKRDNIQRGCRKLRQICSDLPLPYKMLTWDMDRNGEWSGNIKGIDDYLVSLKKN